MAKFRQKGETALGNDKVMQRQLGGKKLAGGVTV
jgi:hypothetical protein